MITVRADPVEREALLAEGDPFFVLAYVGNAVYLSL